MATLVIDTATEACSVALIDGSRVVASIHEVVGRGHAERLLPMIAELPGGGAADAILVDCGPGSFTGVRVGLAAAIGLGIAWGASVHGYTSTAVIAAGALARAPAPEIAVVLEGGHGEVFVQIYDGALGGLGPLASLTPDAALAAIGDRPAAGNGIRHLLALAPDHPAVHAVPEAADVVLLPAEHLALAARPIYGRAPDAKPQAAR